MPKLYNLDSDIGERKNVATERPDVVARLQGIIRQMTADLGVPKDFRGRGSAWRQRGKAAAAADARAIEYD